MYGDLFFAIPAALLRREHWADGNYAGVFAVDGHPDPSTLSWHFGSRCAR